eukprot:5626831-Lingulodinium_polyedra.AAC.1
MPVDPARTRGGGSASALALPGTAVAFATTEARSSDANSLGSPGSPCRRASSTAARDRSSPALSICS